MADFTYLEEIAGRIKANRQHLFDVDEVLSDVNAKIRELPLKRNAESTFAKMIGVEYHDELEELEQSRDKLVSQKEDLQNSIKKDTDIFITEITSSDLIIPLEPVPKFNDGNTIYKYRDGAKFTNVFDILSELLGLSAPLVVKDVMLSSSEVIVKVSDELEAKKKFINSMNEVQKTLLIKKR
jgi:hypothetical protein